MTHNEYEQHKQRLEEQLRAGIQLLEDAHQAQVRALDLVWMLQAQAETRGGSMAPAAPGTAPAPAPARQQEPPPSDRPRRRGPGELEDGVRAALTSLPDTFTRREVVDALGYEPDRGALYRILQDLVREGSLHVESVGTGQNPTVYRKTGAHDAAGAG